MHKFLRTKALIASVLTLLLFAVYEAKTYTLLSLDRKSQKEDKPTSCKENFITFSRINKAWKYTKGKDTKVAILDWLFDVSPEALKKYLNPTSLIPGEPIGSGEPWHGEWMAEIVHHIAPEAKIIPIRISAKVNDIYHSSGK